MNLLLCVGSSRRGSVQRRESSLEVLPREVAAYGPAVRLLLRMLLHHRLEFAPLLWAKMGLRSEMVLCVPVCDGCLHQDLWARTCREQNHLARLALRVWYDVDLRTAAQQPVGAELLLPAACIHCFILLLPCGAVVCLHCGRVLSVVAWLATPAPHVAWEGLFCGCVAHAFLPCCFPRKRCFYECLRALCTPCPHRGLPEDFAAGLVTPGLHPGPLLLLRAARAVGAQQLLIKNGKLGHWTPAGRSSLPPCAGRGLRRANQPQAAGA